MTMGVINPILLFLKLLAVVLPACSSLAEVAFEGKFENHGVVLVARKDIPNETVTLSGLMLTGIEHVGIKYVYIRCVGRVISIDYFDNKENIVISERLDSGKSDLGGSNGIFFDKEFFSANESGRVLLKISYTMKIDINNRLIVETVLNYKIKRLFFSTRGKDRGIYTFAKKE